MAKEIPPHRFLSINFQVFLLDKIAAWAPSTPARQQLVRPSVSGPRKSRRVDATTTIKNRKGGLDSLLALPPQVYKPRPAVTGRGVRCRAAKVPKLSLTSKLVCLSLALGMASPCFVRLANNNLQIPENIATIFFFHLWIAFILRSPAWKIIFQLYFYSSHYCTRQLVLAVPCAVLNLY